jgi:hypothetical protein
MEEIKREMELLGQVNIISKDETEIIVYEENIEKELEYYSFHFKKNFVAPIIKKITSYNLFKHDYQEKIKGKNFRPLWLDDEEYPCWFVIDSPYKNQIIQEKIIKLI